MIKIFLITHVEVARHFAGFTNISLSYPKVTGMDITVHVHMEAMWIFYWGQDDQMV